MTTEIRRILDCSCEKQSKIFEEEIIVIPTWLMILLQQLKVDKDDDMLILTLIDSNLHTTIQIRKHLLDANKSTVKLSFQLIIKKKITGKEGKVFKA